MSFDGHERELGTHQLPDNLVGIGGVGKAVVDRFLSTDWIIEEAVGAAEHGVEFQAYIVDTATDERAVDESHVAEHNDRIGEVAEEFGLDLDLFGTDVHVQYLNPVEHTPDAVLSGGGAAVGDVGEGGDPNAWWLRDDEVSTDRGYDVGTVRRRADGKALLQASQRGDGEMADLPEQMTAGPTNRTTIVAGLGGGTGSGMATELAKQIKAAGGRVTLVGILPAVGAHDRVRANAFATLSELEYLAVTDRNPFEHIVLLPYGPASDLDYQDTFLDGVVETIVAREHLGVRGNYLNEGSAEPIPKQFAPFTLATPQTLRYNVEDIRRRERSIQEYCDAKREALDAELELYEALHDYFADEWGGEIGQVLEQQQGGGSVNRDQFGLSSIEANSLRARLDDLQSWIEDTERCGVDNEALRTWRAQLGEWIDYEQEMHSDHPQEEIDKRLVTRVPERVENLEPVEDTYSGEPAEQELASVFRDELRAIRHRAELLRVRSILQSEDTEVGEALAATLDPQDGFTAIERLDAVVDETEHQLHRYRANRQTLDELESVLIEERDELETSWCNAVMDDIDGLLALETHAEAVRTRLEPIGTEIERSLGTIENARTPENLPWEQFSIDFGRLNERLQTLGIEPVDVNAIDRSIEHAAAAFEAWHEYNRDSLLDALPIRDRKADAREQYLTHVEAVDDRFVQVAPAGDYDLETDFQCRSSVRDRFDEIRAELDEKRAHHHARLGDELERLVSESDLSDVVDPYRDRWEGDDFDIELPNVPDNASDRIEAAVADGFDAESTDAALDGLLAADPDSEGSGVVRAILDEALLEPVRSRQERLDTDASDAEARLERYDRLREIVTGVGMEFDGIGPAHPEVPDPSPVDLDSDDPYVTKVESNDQWGLLQYHDIADSGVWTDRSMGNEKRKIERYFEKRFVEEAIRNTDLNGLTNRLIGTKNTDGQYTDATSARYDGHHVANVFLSRAFSDDWAPTDPITTDIRDLFEDSSLYFRSDGDGYSHRSVGFGAPWDLSMVTFVSGVFLDNIRGIERYKQAYESQQAESGGAIRSRHAHGLDGRDSWLGDGGERGYVYRDTLLDLDDPDDLYTLLDSTETEMIEALLEQYIERATVPESGDSE
jgi:hypothetical protein